MSGPALARDHKLHTGQDLSPREIADRAADPAAHPEADASFRRYENRMARSLASIINVIDPDVVVLGGGLSNVDRLYSNVPLLWSGYTFSGEITTRLVRAEHGDSSGVRGAAWLWPQDPPGSENG